MNYLQRKAQNQNPIKMKISNGAYACMLLCSQAMAVTPSLVIPQFPLILATPLHPQVLLAIGNSQSMDGNLSGAIMTGSGALALALNSLSSSSSPTNYVVPTGFTPPVQAANGLGQAPYTVTQSGKLVDNSASRLNTAKGAVQAIINTYMQSTDFALEVYNTSGAAVYSTWVYYMSPTGSNFIFTNDNSNAANRYVNNPCYNYTLASATVLTNCLALAGFYGGTTVLSNQYMQIGASSDDPNINDVLYASSVPGVYLTYTGPTPATPFPPNFSLANYNSGNVSIAYSKSLPNIGGFSTSPTNAGFVPYSSQVIYSQRGFGYYGSQTANTGNVIVPMTTAGTTPTTTSVTNAINIFAPYLNPETNSTSTTEIKSVAVQSPAAGLLTKANSYLSALAATSGNGCPQKKYVIYISDGLPTQDLSGKLWPPLGSASATGYGVTATFNGDGSLNTTNCQALTDAVNAIKTLKTNNILTYVIGLGAGVSPTLNPQAAATLTAMAVVGGTLNYYPATDPQSLANQLNAILVAIQNGSFSTSAASISSTRLTGTTVEYQASFVSNDVPYQDWTGDLAAIVLDPITGIPSSTTLWTAKPLLNTLAAGTGWSSSRHIATWNPVSTTGVPFLWANLSTAQQIQLQPSDTKGSNRLDYLRGNTALEQRNGGTFRNRSAILGDIMDSQVLYVGAPQGSYLSTSYITFAKAQASRQAFIYVGGNDGMLHAFNATTGIEAFAFVPNAIFQNLINLTLPLYNQSHLYFVNGSPVSGDVQFSDSSWRTVVISGENGGGNSIFALDVTNPTTVGSSDTSASQAVLWEFTDADMGLSYSTPQVAQIGLANAVPSTFAVFFGNGYNSATNSAVFYAINPQTGAVIKKIDLCASVPGACNASLPQGLSSVAVGQFDGIQGVPITVVYAGDLQGNLWAIDVANTDPTLWTARLLFQSGNSQPITTPPVVTLHPNYPRNQGLFVMFGTGQLLTQNDLQDTQTQAVYGVWDKPLSSTVFTRSNLQQQTLTLVGTASSGLSVPILTSSSTAINWNSQVGWYNNLPVAGQRVVTVPDIFNGAFVTTINTPPSATCAATFSSMLLEINFKTGGATSQVLLDVYGNVTLSANVVGVGLGNTFTNSPVILGPNKSDKMVILTTHSDGTQSTTNNPNISPRKIGWWQLQ